MRLWLLLGICWCFLSVEGAFHLTWGVPAVSLDTNPPEGDFDLRAKIAMDVSGNAVAIWNRTVGGQSTEQVWASCYTHAQRTWAGVFCLSGNGSAGSSEVVIDGEGTATLLWYEGFPSQIVLRRRSAQGVWTPPLEEPPVTVWNSSCTQKNGYIALEEGGDGCIVWTEVVGGEEKIHSALYGKGGEISFLGSIPTKEKKVYFHSVSPVAIGGGVLGVVWEEKHPLDGWLLYGAEHRGEGWGDPYLLSKGLERHTPSLCIDSFGKIHAVWKRDGEIVTIFDTLYDEPTLLSDRSWQASHPSLAVDGEGNSIVVYSRYDVPPGQPPFNLFIAAVHYDAKTGKWSTPVDISAPSRLPLEATSGGFPVVATNAIGDGVAIWKEYTGDRLLVQGAGFSLGTWSLARTISPLYAADSRQFADYDLGVAVNLAGNALAVWPEDPRGIRSPQIKATLGVGLAIVGPRPPLVHKDAASLYQRLVADALSPPTKGGEGPRAPKFEAEELPCGPGAACGVQIIHRFPAHADLINVLCWSPSEDPGVYYRVYRGSFETMLGTTRGTYFEDHQRPPNQTETYFITAVDGNGQESAPVTFFVAPLKRKK